MQLPTTSVVKVLDQRQFQHGCGTLSAKYLQDDRVGTEAKLLQNTVHLFPTRGLSQPFNYYQLVEHTTANTIAVTRIAC